MAAVSVEIWSFIDEHFPGFVECRLVDADGHIHTFVEKSSVVSDRNLLAGSQYPCAGTIACEVVSEFTDSQGRLLVGIDTKRPFGVESSSVKTKFFVLPSQLVR